MLIKWFNSFISTNFLMYYQFAVLSIFLSIYKVALLKYNLHTIQVTHLSCSDEWFLLYSEIHASPPLLIF